MACYLNVISIIIVATQFIFKVLPWLYENLMPILAGSKIKFAIFGDWALVTGATDGIGKAYAKALAKEGMNIILISRTKQKLDNVAAEIESQYKVRTKTIVVDFTDDAENYAPKIAAEIKGCNIGVLVNNVGVSYNYPEYFLEVQDRDRMFSQIIKCNIISVVEMTKLVLPQMKADQKGIILNISSIAATIPQPLLAVYSASKAFVDKFSEDISTEYREQGIIIQSVLPGFVVTNMTKLRRTNLLAPAPDTYVASAIRTIGYARHTTGYWPHALKQLLITSFYGYLPDVTNSIVFYAMKKIKNKSLKLNAKFKEENNKKE